MINKIRVQIDTKIEIQQTHQIGKSSANTSNRRPILMEFSTSQKQLKRGKI